MSDDSLFREVDEEVRQDQLKKIWDQYGNYILALCVGIVLAVAALKGWQYWQVKQSQSAAATYADALKLIADGKRNDGEKALSTIGHPGFGRVAKLRQAASLGVEGKTDEAVAIYDGIAADGGADPSLRDLPVSAPAISLPTSWRRRN